MLPNEIIRAWKDEDYRSQLGAEELSALPPNPAGVIDLSDNALGGVVGAIDPEAFGTHYLETLGCCQGITQMGKCDITYGWPVCTTNGCTLTIIWTAEFICKPQAE